MTREMKESGISWIGKIPEIWSQIRLKYLVNIETGDSDTQDADPDGEYNFYVRSPIIEHSSHYTFSGDSILMAGDGVGAGKVFHYATGKYAVHQRVYCLHDFSPAVNSQFLFLYLSNRFPVRVEQGSAKSTVDSIRLPMLKDFPVLLPSIDEQERIVEFLKEKYYTIDSLASNIQKEIETFEAYKKSLITEAVTKGLDKSVPMKDSGIPWIGKIPASWNVKPLFLIAQERKNPNRFLREHNLLSLSYGRIVQKDINTNEGLLPASFSTYNIIENNDIVIRPTDLQNDKKSLRTGFSTVHGIITSAYITLKIKEGVPQYYHYLLHSYDLQKVFYNMGNGVRQGLNYSEFCKLMVIMPSEQEQVSITRYLNSKCLEIDTIISSKKQQLETLASYKKSLIYEYVTGKKEVK